MPTLGELPPLPFPPDAPPVRSPQWGRRGLQFKRVGQWGGADKLLKSKIKKIGKYFLKQWLAGQARKGIDERLLRDPAIRNAMARTANTLAHWAFATLWFEMQNIHWRQGLKRLEKREIRSRVRV